MISWVWLLVSFLGACVAQTDPDPVVYRDGSNPVEPWAGDMAPGPGAAPMDLGGAGAMADAPLPPPGEPAPELPAMDPADPGATPVDPGMPADPGAPPPASGAPATMLVLDYTTLNQGGKYAPDNIGAVWVTDASGKWVRTLEFWAFIRAKYLSKYNSAGAGSALDAITGATLPAHGPHHRVWDLKDSAGTPVPPGAYTIHIEVTEREDKPGESLDIPITLDGTAVPVSVPPSPFYEGVNVLLQ